MGEKSDHITDFRPYYCTALNLQGSWFSASDAARLGVGGKGVWAVGDPFYWHGDYSP
jgi:hypothetical protein